MKHVLTALLVLNFSAGCATIRVVSTRPKKGGVIAIQAGLWGQEEARAKAESAMRSNCRGKFEITEEGEFVIGTTSRTQGNAEQNDKRGGSSTQTTSSTDTTNKTEHRITYECAK